MLMFNNKERYTVMKQMSKYNRIDVSNLTYKQIVALVSKYKAGSVIKHKSLGRFDYILVHK